MFFRHPILSTLTVLYLGAVGWITLGPQPFNSSNDSIILRIVSVFSRHNATKWIDYPMLEFLANVAMFVPIGLFFLLLLGRRQWWLAIIAGVVLSLGIEFTQSYLPTRVTDIRDIVANSTGGLVGVIGGLIVTTPKARRLRREADARRSAGTRVARTAPTR